MTTAQEKFTRKILSIEDVKGFILARDDGQILAHQLSAWHPETVASMMVLNGLDCDQIKHTMGFSHFDYWILTLKNNEHLLVFPVRNYFLGVWSSANRFNTKIAAAIKKFIREITRQSAESVRSALPNEPPIFLPGR